MREEGKGRREEGRRGENFLENHFTVLNVYSLSTVIAGIDKKGGIRFYRSIQTRASKGAKVVNFAACRLVTPTTEQSVEVLIGSCDKLILLISVSVTSGTQGTMSTGDGRSMVRPVSPVSAQEAMAESWERSGMEAPEGTQEGRIIEIMEKLPLMKGVARNKIKIRAG